MQTQDTNTHKDNEKFEHLLGEEPNLVHSKS